MYKTVLVIQNILIILWLAGYSGHLFSGKNFFKTSMECYHLFLELSQINKQKPSFSK